MGRALSRVPALFDLTIKIAGILGLVVAVCFWLDVSLNLWAILPLAFLLEPAKYYTTGHQMKASEAIPHALRMVRRQWLPIFVVYGALTCLSAALPQRVGQAMRVGPHSNWPAAEFVGRVSAHLGADFVGLLATCGLYFALEEAEGG